MEKERDREWERKRKSEFQRDSKPRKARCNTEQSGEMMKTVKWREGLVCICAFWQMLLSKATCTALQDTHSLWIEHMTLATLVFLAPCSTVWRSFKKDTTNSFRLWKMRIKIQSFNAFGCFPSYYFCWIITTITKDTLLILHMGKFWNNWNADIILHNVLNQTF